MKTTKALFGILTITAALAVQVQAQTSNLVTTLVMQFTSAQNLATPVLPLGNHYFFLVTGRYGTGPGDRGEAMSDAFFNTFITTTLDQYHDPYHWWQWNGAFTNRPNPDVYQTNHLYRFDFTGRGVAEVLTFIDGGPYGDNVGMLTFQLYQQNPKFQLILGPFSSWTDAKADAESRGGHLATIVSGPEWQQFTNEISAAWTKNEPIWMGASDAAQEGVWKWVTGEAWSYTRWGAGQPSGSGVNGEEHYLSLSKDWTWNDSALSIQYPIGYALEYEPEGALVKAVKPAFTKLSLGVNYQLQISTDLNTWTNCGDIFTATNPTWRSTNYWDVDNWNKVFFRLQIAP